MWPIGHLAQAPWTGFLSVRSTLDRVRAHWHTAPVERRSHRQPPALYQDGLDTRRGLSTSPVFKKNHPPSDRTLGLLYFQKPWRIAAVSHAQWLTQRSVCQRSQILLLPYRRSVQPVGLLQRASVEPREPLSRYVALRIDTQRMVFLVARRRHSVNS